MLEDIQDMEKGASNSLDFLPQPARGHSPWHEDIHHCSADSQTC